MNTKILEEIGLTPGEIKTYLALLKLGQSTTGAIAKESQVSRSKLYIILDKLEKKGLVSHIEQKGITYFQAAEPKKINNYLKEKEKTLKQLEHDFQKFLPRLNAIHEDAKKEQTVRFYQGFKGLITAFEHYHEKLKKGEEYVSFGVPQEQPESHHLYWQRDHVRRAKEGIKCKILFNKNTPKTVLANRNSYKGCEARYMPININSPSYNVISKDTVMLAVLSSTPITIEIISQEIADSFKEYFWEFWKRSEKFKK